MLHTGWTMRTGCGVIAHFVGQVLADAPKDVVQNLQALRDEQLERTRAVVDTVVALHR
ncbi:hypothetical protein [Streptomyces sp. YIM S03343]